MNDINLHLASLEVLIPIVASFASTLKRFLWTHEHGAERGIWTTICTLVDLLPDL